MTLSPRVESFAGFASGLPPGLYREFVLEAIALDVNEMTVETASVYFRPTVVEFTDRKPAVRFTDSL